MKEIKALIHNNRIADVIQALVDQGYLDITNPQRCRNLNVAATQSLLRALNAQEQRYSVQLGQPVIHESKLELLCDNTQIDALLALIEHAARTGQSEAGCIYVNSVEHAVQIGRHANEEAN